MIPALILAAGAGRRMGGPKAMLLLDGETLLQRTVRIAREADCTPVIAVVGDWEPGPLDPTVRVIRNAEAAEGMASSIRAGLAALPGPAAAVLLLAIDQPAVDAFLLRRLLLLHAAQDGAIPVACAYGDSLGIPAIFPVRLFPALLALEGDQGAKPILLRENTVSLPFPDGTRDLDTPEDLARLTR